MDQAKNMQRNCPVPITDYQNILLAHGGGGKLMHELIDKMLMPAFGNHLLETRHDGAVIDLGGARVAFTTDSYVVKPLFFPGGDIGTLAVNGTVNDLSMCGARPLYLSAGLILEEGLPMETLWLVTQSMQQAAENAGVKLVTGDTKVVDRGSGDGIFINTAGIGVIEHNLTISPQQVQPGDVVLVSGDIGRHGIAVMAAREELALETPIDSDCAPVAQMVEQLIKADIAVHCLRDLTRGGLAHALIEIAQTARLHIDLDQKAIPVRHDIHGVCEILGFDPLYIANEGRFVAFVPRSSAEHALSVLRSHELGGEASIIGEVTEDSPGVVTIRSSVGGTRTVSMLSGEQLPRIC